MTCHFRPKSQRKITVTLSRFVVDNQMIASFCVLSMGANVYFLAFFKHDVVVMFKK